MTASLAVATEPGRVYLHPGQLAASANPCVVTTILGSCVAVSLYDPYAGVGGINHYLLPRAPAGDVSARFGNVAVPQLLDAVVRLGADKTRLLAKVVGGACVIDVYRDRRAHLGRQNASIALELLQALDIPVVLLETGGQRGRRLVFHPHTGDLVVRSL